MSKRKTPSKTTQAPRKSAANTEARTAPEVVEQQPTAAHKRTRRSKAANHDAKGRFKKGHSVGAETRWPAGISGNPSGRSSEQQQLDQIVAQFLAGDTMVNDTTRPGQKVAMPRLQYLLHRLFDLSAGARNPEKAIDMLFDRAYGKPKQPLEHQGMGNVYIVDSIEDLPKPEPQAPTPGSTEQ